MLRKLSIQNFVLIDSASIEFCPNFNILTGETGGGKSVIATAISLLGGERAKEGYVRKGFEKAILEGEFEISEGKDKQIFVKREVDCNGKSRCFIDGEPVSITVLREKIGRILCMASQHEQIVLLGSDSAREMLDDFGGIKEIVLKYRDLYKKWIDDRNRLLNLKNYEKEREFRLEFLKSRINEIKQAQLRAGEEEEIRSKLSIIKNHSRIAEALTKALNILFESEENAYLKISDASRYINNICNLTEFLNEPAKILSDVKSLMSDLETYLRKAADSMEFDEHSLNLMQERLYLIERLKKKYSAGIEEIIAISKKMEEEMLALDNYEDSVRDLEKEISKIGEELVEEAKKISEERKRVATRFSRAVNKEIKELGFGRAIFEAEVRARDEEEGNEQNPLMVLDEWGMDDVDFLFKPNEGEISAPLRRIASGGELSRVMLAIKVAMKSKGGGEIFVFDEIDSGIGGKVAGAVGKKLHTMAKSNQVICITHLPQIAAFADRHFVVEKKFQGGRTITLIRKIEENERVEELARMISVEKVTGKGRDAAMELIEGVRGKG